MQAKCVYTEKVWLELSQSSQSWPPHQIFMSKCKEDSNNSCTDVGKGVVENAMIFEKPTLPKQD